ncbi:MAG: BatA domain-containing protein [Pirellulales bacterium]|nr:BatA domain-containing protein [Pirellulales bacterium]
MPSFLYPLPLALVGGLIALPILIHLINMMRHRRVQWAAMEFLLVSQKRNRTWVMFKQLLLLLLRMAALAAVILVVTQPIVKSGLFGGGRQHHLVLLDDSFSMSDHWADKSAFDEAKQMIHRLAVQAAQQPARQELSLLRFSKANQTSHGTRYDLANESVDTGDFVKKLDQALEQIHCSQTSTGPAEALKTAVQLADERGDVESIVYLVSDFRAKDWSNPGELLKLLHKIEDVGGKLMLVNCVDASRPNLAISGLRPARGVRAAGVPLQVEVTVQNYSTVPATSVAVRLDEQGTQRPAIEIDKIEPGRSVTRQFEVRAPSSGQRRISAFLPADTIMLDNVRHSVIDFANGVPVLVIDGGLQSASAKDGDGYYVQSALSQPGPVPTGLRPRIEPPRFLDEHDLDEFPAVWLCNVDRLPAATIDKLTKFVESGGGLAIFVGENTSAQLLKQLYNDGNGLLPAPVEAPVPLLADQAQKSPDMQITNHPLFRIFAGDNNPFIKTVNISQYFAVKKGWKPAEGSTVNIVASARNGAPLVVEKKVGEGRVVAFLTTAGPRWNNWARGNPSFVVTMLELQSYISAGKQLETSRQVGVPWKISIDPKKYLDQVEFALPQEGTGDRVLVRAEPQPKGPAIAKLADTDYAGLYEATLTQRDSTQELLAVAYNVDAAEGDLNALSREQLKAVLPKLNPELLQVGDLFIDSSELQGSNLSQTILFALIFLLMGEQLLAYSASYHPARRQGGAA